MLLLLLVLGIGILSLLLPVLARVILVVRNSHTFDVPNDLSVCVCSTF